MSWKLDCLGGFFKQIFCVYIVNGIEMLLVFWVIELLAFLCCTLLHVGKYAYASTQTERYAFVYYIQVSLLLFEYK